MPPKSQKQTQYPVHQPSNPSRKTQRQREIDSSSHRLSRPSQKFTQPKAIQAEPESFSTIYFRNHPESVDVRLPTDKLDEMSQQLTDESLEPSERFTS